MEINEYIKLYRNKHNWTQKELADQLKVSDKTISSWETGRTYPDISMLISLSQLFNVTLDEFIQGDGVMIKKIDNDLKLKKIYKISLFTLLALITFVFACLALYQGETIYVDRFNPFIKTRIGYAVLPETVTYNGGQAYNEQEAYKEKKRTPQGSDPYENIWVQDTPFDEGMWLTFQGGQHPIDKNYAMVKHKGAYVSEIIFVSLDEIPADFRRNFSKVCVPENN